MGSSSGAGKRVAGTLVVDCHLLDLNLYQNFVC
jgi:hypothetical protein